MNQRDGDAVRDALAIAEQHVASGNMAAAEALLRELVSQSTPSAQACFRLALLEFRKGHLAPSIELLKRAAQIDPENPVYYFRLGHVQQHAGQINNATKNFLAASKLDPRNVQAMLRAGILLCQTGEAERGAELIQRAALIEPGLYDADKNTKLSAETKREINTALDLLKKQYLRMNEQVLDELATRHPAAGRVRFEKAMRILRGQAKPVYGHPLQHPEFMLIPGMKARPWFEREEFPWVSRIEGSWQLIRDELQGLLDSQAQFDPYIVKPMQGQTYQKTKAGTDFSALVGSKSWTAFHLNRAGVIEENYALCPETRKVMDSLPLPEAEAYMPEIFFSRLQPGAHIIPHFGQTNFRLTVHLALIVPDGCAIRVGEETRTWEEGKILAFDDSFKHEAWNRGSSERIVLIFESWHPDIWPAEIDGLQIFFRQRADWLRRCQPGNSNDRV